MRNKCEDCGYLSYNNEDCNCGIDPYEFNCEDGCGCPYSQEMLALLNHWQDFRFSESFPGRIISEYEHAIELEEELKEKLVDVFDRNITAWAEMPEPYNPKENNNESR